MTIRRRLVGQINDWDKPTGLNAARLPVRAIPQDKFEGICAILKDC